MKQSIEFHSRTENLAKVRAFVRQFLAAVSFPENEGELLVLGVDEACTNVIRHAYKHAETELIALSCEKLRGKVCFKLRDYGTQADPSQWSGRSLEEATPGGLGLHFIRTAFDQVDWHLLEEGTELVLTKKIAPKRE